MALSVASADLEDDQFLEAFESAELDPSKFRHADHLRFAWLCLHRATPEQAEKRVAGAIKQFAERQGAADRYHETITLAWVRLISTHHESSFDEFLSDNESRLNIELLHRFWTPELLASDLAKHEWIAPDRHALPG